MHEKWSWIRGYRGYYKVSTHGRVKSVKRTIIRSDGQTRIYKGRILRPGISKMGYPIVGLCKGGINKTHYVHLLVASKFLPPKPSGKEIKHKDGNKANPNANNLEWKSHRYNALHSIRKGLRKRFVMPKGIKLNKKRRKEIRRLHKTGKTQIELAALFGVHRVSINRVIHRKLAEVIE